MDHLRADYETHFQEVRPRPSHDDEPLRKIMKRVRVKTRRGKVDERIVPLTEVRCKQRLGAQLKSKS